MLNEVEPTVVAQRLSSYWTAMGVVAALVLNFSNPFSIAALNGVNVTKPDVTSGADAEEVYYENLLIEVIRTHIYSTTCLHFSTFIITVIMFYGLVCCSRD
jgi:hypothetical protein